MSVLLTDLSRMWLTCSQIVTSYLDSAARNMGFKEQLAVSDARYRAV